MSGAQKSGLRVVVGGMIAGHPNQGGATWAVLQYVLGLRELGHDVVLVEPVAGDSLRPEGCALSDSLSAEYFRRVVGEFGLEGRAALVLAGSRDSIGLDHDRLVALCRGADVLLDISGMLLGCGLVEDVPVRVYVDLDPAFNQLWHAVEGIDVGFGGHTHFVTVGLAVGTPDCPVPTCGLDWIPTLQPVVLSRWTVADERAQAFTTIANWRGYGSIMHAGVHHGQKAHSLRSLMDLPQSSAEPILLALAIDPGERPDLAALAAHGWSLTDPASVAGDPAAYQAFIRGSRGELGVAKSGYVASRCAWFSDRSVCYLASGRPVVAQDTGFSRHLPTGAGLFAFTDTEEAAEALAAVAADYERHRRAARALAEDHFDSALVLGSLLRSVGAA